MVRLLAAFNPSRFTRIDGCHRRHWPRLILPQFVSLRAWPVVEPAIDGGTSDLTVVSPSL
jgi:hypothetical protein